MIKIVSLIILSLFSLNISFELIASRGVSSMGQENTRSAFDALPVKNTERISQGLPQIVGVEWSGMVTNSGDIILNHDVNVKEATGQDVDIRTLTHQQIEDLDVLQKGYSKPEKFLFMETAFRDYLGKMRIWISVKDHYYSYLEGRSKTAIALIALFEKLAREGLDMTNVLVSSTNMFIVTELANMKIGSPIESQLPEIFFDYSTKPTGLNWALDLLLKSGYLESAYKCRYVALVQSFASEENLMLINSRGYKSILWGGDLKDENLVDFKLIDA